MASLRDEIGDFVAVPVSFMEDDQQTAESRVVFLVLRFHTNRRRKRAFPGYETIMRESGLSRQKTAAGIKVLVETGWLVKHKVFAKNTEYELRYPSPSYSSTEELREAPAIVPPANVDSSTMEQPPLSVTNKIEFNKIKSRGYRQPVKLPDEKYDLPPDPFPITTDLSAWLAEMCFSFSEPELADATQAWRESRESRPDRRKRTMEMWRADWKKFIRVYWEIRQRNGNGHKRAGDSPPRGNPAFMAPEKPVDYFEKINAQYRGK